MSSILDGYFNMIDHSILFKVFKEKWKLFSHDVIVDICFFFLHFTYITFHL